MRARRIATLVTSLTLALPGGALAQSAGDDEYVNPLPESEPAETQATPAPTPTPAPEPQAQTAQEPAAEPAPDAAELPRTGAPAALVGAVGGALLAGGLRLRRRT